MPDLRLSFDDSFVRSLPGDPDPENRRRLVPGACYSRVAPTPVRAPRLVAWSDEVRALLGLPDADLAETELAEVLGGNRLLPGMVPYAARYGGHQFGNWAGQLGDGRAITLGEVVRDGGRWEVQLKGAGPTPYSRGGDGRAVLRSSLRELVCSEAMHHLGVPTTRALGLVTTGEDVVRDMFYDGRPEPEPGAIVCRVAPSFLRFGNFEVHAEHGEDALLGALARYAIATHFPDLAPALPPSGPPPAELVVRWLDEIARRTAVMVAHWMRVGFVHGVMNTDNMSILGLTLDYGPYGWLDAFDLEWTPNTTDATGRRYRFGHQPKIALWNLVRFAEALLPLVGEPAPLEEVLTGYGAHFERAHREMIAGKLGLPELHEEDEALVDERDALLAAVETDFTIFHRTLAGCSTEEGASDEARAAPFEQAHYRPSDWTAERRSALGAWLSRWAGRVRQSGRPDAERRAAMRAASPCYVPRNYLAQLAIDRAAQGDFSEVRQLMEVLRRPYEEQPGREAYAARRPEWARHRAGCSMLSCSS